MRKRILRCFISVLISKKRMGFFERGRGAGGRGEGGGKREGGYADFFFCVAEHQ